MPAKRKTPESGVLRACLDLLAAERIFHRRWNTGAVKADKRFFRFGQPGDADIQVIIPIHRKEIYSSAVPGPGVELSITHQQVIWLECKSESGKQSAEQKLFQAEVEADGMTYLLIRDVQELIDWLKANK